ncbi:epithelial chloride channel -like protein [Labeo rohita]|nr:epithelial chloride channel -like protein [Labeo rohita]
MGSRAVFLLWMLLSSTSTGIKLDGNGYVDVVIAISSRVSQDNTLIDKIKDMVTEGSLHLYEALDKKVYLKEATILVPPQWNSKDFTRARTESFEKARIRIDNPNPAYGDEPYTNRYGKCGIEGEYIHVTPNFLRNNTLTKPYGSKGRVFVHEWADLRWGIYDEYSDKKPFYYSNDHIEATRITDLNAEIQNNTVLLSWTAPGEDLDHGTAKSYKIKWSLDFKMLQFNFSNAHEVNISGNSPQ